MKERNTAPQNRRAAMTERMLKDALGEMLGEMPLEKVSVRGLCERADLNRSTFYLHYETIEDLLRDYTQDYMTHVWAGWQRDRLGEYDYLETVEYIQAHADAFRVLLRTGMYHDYIMRQYAALDFAGDPELAGIDRDSCLLVSTYAIAGSEQLLLFFLEHPGVYDATSVAQVLHNMSEAGAQEVRRLSVKNK